MNKTAKIQFLFPIKDSRMKQPVNFTDLQVTAHAEIGRHNQILEIKIRKVLYFNKGETEGYNIAGLLQVIKPELFKEICDATESHAISISETKEVA